MLAIIWTNGEMKERTSWVATTRTQHQHQFRKSNAVFLNHLWQLCCVFSYLLLLLLYELEKYVISTKFFVSITNMATA